MVVAWYSQWQTGMSCALNAVPELTRAHVQQHIAAATRCLQQELAKTIDFDNTHDRVWRSDPAFFRFPKPAEFEPGSVDLSPSWFQQRKDVCNCFICFLSQDLHHLPLIQRLVDKLSPSQTLSKEGASAGLSCIEDTEHDINKLMQLIAPQLFQAGMAAIGTTKQLHSDHPNIGLWASAFSAIGVIVNRITPAHRDAGGWKACYDLLVAAGTYKMAYLDLPDLGARIEYNPGTAVAITGKILRHAVVDWKGGERICYAHYMRNNVHQRLLVEQTGWVKEQYFTHWMSRGFLKRRYNAMLK